MPSPGKFFNFNRKHNAVAGRDAYYFIVVLRFGLLSSVVFLSNDTTAARMCAFTCTRRGRIIIVHLYDLNVLISARRFRGQKLRRFSSPACERFTFSANVWNSGIRDYKVCRF